MHDKPSAWGDSFRRIRSWIDPTSGTEDDRRKERILAILLLSLSGTSGLFFIHASASWFIDPATYRGIPPLILFGVFCIFAGLFKLKQAGYRDAASITFLATLAIPITWTMARWGADLPEASLSAALLIVISGILLGSRAAVIAALLSGCVIFGITASQLTGHLNPESAWRIEPLAIDQAFPKTFLFGAIAAVTWLSIREIERSLERARLSEAELVAHNAALEQEVAQRVRQLREAELEHLAAHERFAEFGKLASGILHDLANPINAASLNVQLMEQNGAPSQDELRQASKALNRVTSFLRAARLRYRGSSSSTLFEPREEAEAVLTILGHRARAAHVSVAAHLPDPGSAAGDASQFGQIVLNLVANAIDACEELTHRPGPHVAIDIRNGEDGISIEVADRGVGIPDGAKIFEAFYTTKAPDKGTGIGLSTVKRLVERWGGTISYMNRPEGGTIFHVYLPKSSPSTSG